MKNVKTICFVAVVLFLCDYPALGWLQFKDGLTHDIDYTINDDVWVDYQTPSMFTTVNWLDGGSTGGEWEPYHLLGYEDSRINVRGGYIYGLSSYDSSQVDISGGIIRTGFGIHDSSQVNISGGSIRHLSSSGSSHVDISGGLIGGDLYSLNSSQVNISGGWIGDLYVYDFSHVDISGGYMIGGGDWALDEQGRIRIFGSDFAVDGQPVGYGELTSINGGYTQYEPSRHLTGTLLNGGLIDRGFRIGHEARIVLVPEPASALLMTLGAIIVTLRRKKR